MTKIQEGTRWSASDRKVFIVIHEIEVDGHTWVHYRDEKGEPAREYSCYKESFLSRFSKLPDDR